MAKLENTTINYSITVSAQDINPEFMGYMRSSPVRDGVVTFAYEIVFSNTIDHHNLTDVDEVARHEVAHYIDHRIRHMTCHDSYWQKVYETCGGLDDDYLSDRLS